jgi:hypothetical protein
LAQIPQNSLRDRPLLPNSQAVSGLEDLIDVGRSRNVYLTNKCILNKAKGMPLIHTADSKNGVVFEVPRDFPPSDEKPAATV